jgi:hypothetical protein
MNLLHQHQHTYTRKATPPPVVHPLPCQAAHPLVPVIFPTTQYRFSSPIKPRTFLYPNLKKYGVTREYTKSTVYESPKKDESKLKPDAPDA